MRPPDPDTHVIGSSNEIVGASEAQRLTYPVIRGCGTLYSRAQSSKDFALKSQLGAPRVHAWGASELFGTAFAAEEIHLPRILHFR